MSFRVGLPHTALWPRSKAREVVDPRTSASWPIAQHTAAKHALLAAYLRAWFPILNLGGFSRAIYIDGFAGPGRYTHGEDG